MNLIQRVKCFRFNYLLQMTVIFRFIKRMSNLVSADKNKVIEQFIIHCYTYKEYVEIKMENFLTYKFEDKCNNNKSLF